MQVASVGTPQHAALVALPEDVEPPSEELRRVEVWQTHYERERLVDFLWHLTKDCLEDLGIGQYQRVPSGRATWRDMQNAEDQLLAQLDAVLCFGPELETRLALDQLALEEPGDAFARTLVAGSTRSAASLGSIESILRAALAIDPEVFASAVLGLQLGAHPQSCVLARKLLADSEPELRAAGLRVLDFRGEITLQDLAPIRTDGPAVVMTAALHALRHPRIPAEEYQRWNQLLDHDDEVVVAAAIETGTIKRSIRAHGRAVQLCEAGKFGLADAALVLGMSGDERDANHFAEWLAEHSDPALFNAVGYFGLADHVPLLIERLRKTAGDARSAVAQALERITGAGVVEQVTDPLYEEDEKPFVDDPDATITDQRFAEAPEAWRAWLAARPGAFVPGHRYRYGQLFDAMVAFRALDRGPAEYSTRRLHDLELRLLAGDRGPHLSIRDWIAHQHAGMTAWEEWLRSRAPALTRGFIRARA